MTTKLRIAETGLQHSEKATDFSGIIPGIWLKVCNPFWRKERCRLRYVMYHIISFPAPSVYVTEVTSPHYLQQGADRICPSTSCELSWLLMFTAYGHATGTETTVYTLGSRSVEVFSSLPKESCKNMPNTLANSICTTRVMTQRTTNRFSRNLSLWDFSKIC